MAISQSDVRAELKKILPDWLLSILRYRKLRKPDFLVAIRNYQKSHGQLPNLIRPQTFNEKVLHRMLFDRRMLLTQLADKAAVRSFVRSRLGEGLLPQLYYLTTHPQTIPFDELPQKFVVKPTHGSSWVSIVRDKTTVDRELLIKTCLLWLSVSFYEITREWVYKNIRPRIIIEQFIDDGTGNTPNDYKLFVFDGKVEMIQVDVNRFTDHQRRLYRPSWDRLPVLFKYEDISGDVPAPPHLAEMIAAAETLGADLDFIRVDFYDTLDRLYFGELTTTPECATGCFRPREFDHILGSCWTLPKRRERISGPPAISKG